MQRNDNSSEKLIFHETRLLYIPFSTITSRLHVCIAYKSEVILMINDRSDQVQTQTHHIDKKSFTIELPLMEKLQYFLTHFSISS